MLPSYWLVQAGHVGLGGDAWSTRGWVVIAIWSVAWRSQRPARTSATRAGSNLRITMIRAPFGTRTSGLAALFGGEQGAPGGGWRPLLFPGIWLIYLLQTAGGVATYSEGAVEVVGYAVIVLFGAAYLLAIDSARTNLTRYWRFFGAMVLLTVAEIPIAHEDAFVMCVFIAVLIMAGFAFRGHGRAAILAIVGMTAIATFLPAAIPAWDAGAGLEHAASRCRSSRWPCSASSGSSSPTGS